MNKAQYSLAVASITTALTSQSFAIDLLETESPIQYGFTVSQLSYEINDPESKTPTTSSFQPFQVDVIFPANSKRTRWTSSVGYQKFEADAGQKEVGQESTRWFYQGGYRFRYNFTRTIKVWFEGGIGVSAAEFASRHTVDSDGFLSEKFDKRTSTDGYVYLGTSHYWKASNTWDIGLNAKYEKTTGENLEGYSIGINILYN